MTAMGAEVRVCAVIVLYHPDFETLQAVLRSVIPQVHQVVLVNNSPEVRLEGLVAGSDTPQPIAIYQEGNKGIAHAHNVGLAWAEAHDCSHVLLLDQDSIPNPDMVERLLDAQRTLAAQGIPDATVGPRWSSDGRKWSHFVRIGWPLTRRVKCREPGPDTGILNCDFLISSGCLIPMSALRLVGPMNEFLFIDHVDTEWCLRARHKGLSLYGVCSAKMRHTLGDRVLHVWAGRTRNISLHSPLRNYYIVRNSLMLYRSEHAPVSWIVADLLRNTALSILHLAVCPDRKHHARELWRGVKDGMAH